VSFITGKGSCVGNQCCIKTTASETRRVKIEGARAFDACMLRFPAIQYDPSWDGVLGVYAKHVFFFLSSTFTKLYITLSSVPLFFYLMY